MCIPNDNLQSLSTSHMKRKASVKYTHMKCNTSVKYSHMKCKASIKYSSLTGMVHHTTEF